MRVVLFLAAIWFAVPGLGQWQVVMPAPTTADLRGIDNVGGGVVWASGSDGTVLRSEDAGYVWQQCAVPPGAEHLDFRGIQAFDANTAIVMSSGKGNLSRLYKTTDGCQTWKLVFTNPDKDGFWDAMIMTGRTIGMLIGDPIPSFEPQASGESPGWIFPTYHTTNGGLTWRRNDGNRLHAQTDKQGAPSESIFAASNSSMLLVPYLTLFVSGGMGGGFHYEQYTIDTPFLDRETPSALVESDSAGGFSMTANWKLGNYDAPSDLHERALSSDAHAVVIVGGDYLHPDESKSAAAVCKPSSDGELIRFACVAAQTMPHGFRSAVAYDAEVRTWITVGPNGTDISTDDGLNWRALKPGAGDAADADQHWNALSLPFVVGPHGRIGILRPEALGAGKP